MNPSTLNAGLVAVLPEILLLILAFALIAIPLALALEHLGVAACAHLVILGTKAHAITARGSFRSKSRYHKRVLEIIHWDVL